MNDFFSKLGRPHLAKRVLKRIHSYFFLTQWILLIAKEIPDRHPSWNNFTRILPPTDRVWADPFVWIHEGNLYVFFEEQPFDTRRGRINCLKFDHNLNIISNEVVLERPYHLSYPFLFEYEGVLYMIPETGENRTIEIYRCSQFPNRWEKVKDLMTGVHAVDSTLLEAKGKWWLFVNIAEEGGSTWDTLHLFYADHPLSEHWTPHPRNPIIKDVQSARPAGKIFFDGKSFIRPSQDCSVRYGYATNFNRITQLSETEYAEIREWKFRPTARGIIATHTWNQAGKICMIDAQFLRPRF